MKFRARHQNPQRIPHRMWENEPKYQVIMTIKMGIYNGLPFFEAPSLCQALWGGNLHMLSHIIIWLLLLCEELLLLPFHKR